MEKYKLLNKPFQTVAEKVCSLNS